MGPTTLSSGQDDPDQRRKEERERERKLHSDQEMFSCTTLSSRMGRDYYIKSDGCMDYGFNRQGVWELIFPRPTHSDPWSRLILRDREPWEASDGALNLMEQLALAASESAEATSSTLASGRGRGASGPPPSRQPWTPPALLDAVASALPELAELAELRSFRKAATLRETLWKCIPGIARGLGGIHSESAVKACRYWFEADAIQ